MAGIAAVESSYLINSGDSSASAGSYLLSTAEITICDSSGSSINGCNGGYTFTVCNLDLASWQ